MKSFYLQDTLLTTCLALSVLMASSVYMPTSISSYLFSKLYDVFALVVVLFWSLQYMLFII